MDEQTIRSVDRALKQVEITSAIGIGLTAAEFLAKPGQLGDKGLLSWQVEQTRYRSAPPEPIAKAINVLATPPGIHAVFVLRLASALTLLNPNSSPRARTAAVSYIAASTYGLHYRVRYGSDGSDHMTVVTYAALFASKLFPNDARARQACVWFIAGQSMLSYLAAGLAKAAGRSWRTGMAMPGIFRTKAFGDERVYNLLKDRKALSMIGSWSVVIGESLLPLALVAPKKTGWSLLGMGGAFHVGNAVFMGLNRFVWAFGATYPAVVASAKELSLDDPRRAATWVSRVLRRKR